MVENLLKPPLHILARAVIRRGDDILLAQANGSPNTFLPGGHLEPGESLPHSLKRELWEEFGLEAEVGMYMGLVEHSWDQANVTNYELNHLFEVSLPTLAPGKVPLAQEAHLTFFWADVGELSAQGLEPYPLRHLLKDGSASPLWNTTLPVTSPVTPDR